MVLFNHIHSKSFAGMTNMLKLFKAVPSVPAFAALILLWAVLTLAGLGIAPLFDYDEASYAETAVEMRNNGNWLLPILNGQPYYDKPAFVYYCMNASFALFGKNAFAARLPSALFTLATALLLLRVGRRLGRHETGMRASLIYLSMLMPALLAHATILDAVLNFFIAASVLSFFLWQHSGKRSDAFLAMLTAGIAMSVKGPVGVVIPALVVCLDRLLAQDLFPFLRRFPWSAGIPAFLIGALPWYALVTIEYGFGFLRQFVLRENVHRFMHPLEGHSGGWYYYLVVLIPSTLPWVAWLPWWVKQTIARWREKEETNALSRLVLIWTGVVILLFSLAQTKLPHYISSIYPAMALGLAIAWDRQSPSLVWTRAASLFLLVLCLPLALGLLFLPTYYPHLAHVFTHPRAAALFSQGLPSSYAIPIAGALIGVTVFLLLRLITRVRPVVIPMLVILSGFLVQTSLIWSLAPLAGDLLQAPAMKIAAQIRIAPSTEPVYSMVNRPSIAFYSDRSFTDAGHVDIYERFSTSPSPCLLIAYASQLPDLSRLPLQLVMRAADYTLLRYIPRAKRSQHLSIP
jgi:4-amino-4-deoxy-L-arabinose transferase-like glycosyltransferase